MLSNFNVLSLISIVSSHHYLGFLCVQELVQKISDTNMVILRHQSKTLMSESASLVYIVIFRRLHHYMLILFGKIILEVHWLGLEDPWCYSYFFLECIDPSNCTICTPMPGACPNPCTPLNLPPIIHCQTLYITLWSWLIVLTFSELFRN